MKISTTRFKRLLASKTTIIFHSNVQYEEEYYSLRLQLVSVPMFLYKFSLSSFPLCHCRCINNCNHKFFKQPWSGGFQRTFGKLLRKMYVSFFLNENSDSFQIVSDSFYCYLRGIFNHLQECYHLQANLIIIMTIKTEYTVLNMMNSYE